MNASKPIILIDDDTDDLELAMEMIGEMAPGQAVLAYSDPLKALDELRDGKGPDALFILCDVNMPRMGGFELCTQLHGSEGFVHRQVPFLFLSTSVSPADLAMAHDLPVRGYFRKQATVQEAREQLRAMMAYWQASHRPAKLS